MSQDQMKSWRACLASVGFFRAYYEKLEHVHCMAYVKTCPGAAAEYVTARHAKDLMTALGEDAATDPADLMVIPQDRTTRTLLQKESERRKKEADEEPKTETEIAEMMAELPGL